MISIHAPVLQIEQAVTIRQAKTPMPGPREIDLRSSTGLVRIYLPRMVQEGDLISGALFASSEGDWETQHRNLETMSHFEVTINGQNVHLSDSVFTIRIQGNRLNVELLDESGGVQKSIDAPLSIDQGQNGDTSVVVQSGKTVFMAGRFSGDRNQTLATFGGRPIGILAEGAAECYVTAPTDRLGTAEFRVSDGSESYSKKVCVVSLTFLAPGRPTEAGRATSVGVDLEGLASADRKAFPIVVLLTTNDVKVVRFPSPDVRHGTLLISPEDLNAGHVLKSVQIDTVGKGKYNISAEVY
jgi:hypothetical protein